MAEGGDEVIARKKDSGTNSANSTRSGRYALILHAPAILPDWLCILAA